MSHVIHYGSSVFEGIRCYGQPSGSAVFRLPEHMQRLLDSAKIYRMDASLHARRAVRGVVDVIEANGVAPCYIRPIACAATAKSASAPRARPSRSTSPTFPGASTLPARRRGRLRLQLEPPGAQHHAGARQGRRQLHELAAHPHGSRDQRLPGGHRARRQRPGQRGLGREHLRGAQRRALHPAAGQLGALRHHPRLGAHHRPAPGPSRSSSSPCRASCSTSPTRSSSPAPRPRSRPSAPSIASSSATASPARSPRRSPTSSSASPTASSPTASAGSRRSRWTPRTSE
jgi:hypothetical protein